MDDVGDVLPWICLYLEKVNKKIKIWPFEDQILIYQEKIIFYFEDKSG